jgi:phosphoribosylamine--glycine ligase
MNGALQSEIEKTIVQPVLNGMKAEGHPFRGFLYCGLMLTAQGPKVIEFNVRFGDPEAQVVLPLLDNLSDLVNLDGDGFSRRLEDSEASAFRRIVSVGVVLAAHGYPADVRTGDVITGLDDVARDCPDVQIFFAGVKQKGNGLVTSGGRVMTVMSKAPSYEIAIARAYEAASKIKFDGMQYRRDIGRKALQDLKTLRP